MKNSLFISQNVPNTLVKKYNVSQAANNFCLHINELEYFSHHVAIPPANIDQKFSKPNRRKYWYRISFMQSIQA